MSEPISLAEWRKRRDASLKSDAQSQQNTASGQPGEIPTDDEIELLMQLFSVMVRARVEPFTTKSDTARRCANEIGLLASEGLLTTKVHEGSYGNVWLTTEEGLSWMEEVESVVTVRH